MLVLQVWLGDMQDLQASRGNGDQWPQVDALADQRGFEALFPEDPLKSDATAMGSLIHQVDRNAGRVAIRIANREGWGSAPITSLRWRQVVFSAVTEAFGRVATRNSIRRPAPG
jgi:hypothetical protein